jgi:hypothetical protein
VALGVAADLVVELAGGPSPASPMSPMTNMRLPGTEASTSIAARIESGLAL